jgi:heterodisulfide reductase subunit B
MRKITYYPGCSLHSSAREYDESAKRLCELFDIEFEELSDWNCCGATSAHSIDYKIALALPSRNLLLARKKAEELLMLCAACFNRTKAVQFFLEEDPSLRKEVEELLGENYQGGLKIRHLLDVFLNEIGLEEIKKRTVKPLKGLRAVCYYGCLLVRPAKIVGFDDPEHPQSMDLLLEAVGAEPIGWSYKTECCGGALSIPRANVVKKLVGNLLQMAEDAGASCIVTACPLCMANLETRSSTKKLPIFYFTELLGVAFGLKEIQELLQRHLISPMELLGSLGLS